MIFSAFFRTWLSIKLRRLRMECGYRLMHIANFENKTKTRSIFDSILPSPDNIIWLFFFILRFIRSISEQCKPNIKEFGLAYSASSLDSLVWWTVPAPLLQHDRTWGRRTLQILHFTQNLFYLVILRFIRSISELCKPNIKEFGLAYSASILHSLVWWTVPAPLLQHDRTWGRRTVQVLHFTQNLFF